MPRAPQEREFETWTQWVERQKTDPESPTQQFVRAGVSIEFALVLTLLGRIQNELSDMNDNQREDDEDWRHS